MKLSALLADHEFFRQPISSESPSEQLGPVQAPDSIPDPDSLFAAAVIDEQYSSGPDGQVDLDQQPIDDRAASYCIDPGQNHSIDLWVRRPDREPIQWPGGEPWDYDMICRERGCYGCTFLELHWGSFTCRLDGKTRTESDNQPCPIKSDWPSRSGR